MATRVFTEVATSLDVADSFALSLAWSPDGQYLYVGTKDQGLFGFDANSQELIFQSGGEGLQVQAIAMNPDGKTLAVGLGNDNSIRLVSAQTGDLLATIWPAHENWPQALAFSPDGSILASGGDDGQIFLWDGHTGDLIKRLFQGEFWVWGLAFSPNGENLIASFDAESTFRIWNIDTWELQDTLAGDFAADLAFSSDGTKIVTAGGGIHAAHLWNFPTGELLFDLREAPGWVWAVAYDPHNKFVASGGIGEVIILWDVTTGKAILELYTGPDFIQALAINPAGTKLASAGDKVWIWDLSQP
ncbi:MAG: WD40 repeat domain-containing protein [Anaerolineales bacterium]|nr:WD40 repeat domain-containing protein [Anaerolineales bacterium]